MAKKLKPASESLEDKRVPTNLADPEVDAEEQAGRRRYGTSVRISDEFVASLKEAAGIEGMTVSEYSDIYLSDFVKWLYERQLTKKLEAIGKSYKQDFFLDDVYFPPHIHDRFNPRDHQHKGARTVIKLLGGPWLSGSKTYMAGDVVETTLTRAAWLIERKQAIRHTLSEDDKPLVDDAP